MYEFEKHHKTAQTVRNFCDELDTPPCRLLSWEGPALQLISDAGQGWHGVNDTDLKRGGGQRIIF